MWSAEINSIAGKHKTNEDFANLRLFDNGSILAVVADGVGGLSMGNRASELAVNAICNYFDKADVTDENLLAAIEKANDSILSECMKFKCRMGCAIALVYVDDKNGKFISMGDVHVSELKKSGEESLLSEDNVYVASNGNKFLSCFLSDRELIDLPTVNNFSVDEVSEIRIATDGAYNRDVEDDATVIRIIKRINS